MSNSEIITATDASRGFSELLNRVAYSGESFTIKKGNRLMARIVPVEQEAALRPKRTVQKKHVGKKTMETSMQEPASKEKSTLRLETMPVRTEKKIQANVISSGPMSIPSGLTEEDIDFYRGLMAKLPG